MIEDPSSEHKKTLQNIQKQLKAAKYNVNGKEKIPFTKYL